MLPAEINDMTYESWVEAYYHNGATLAQLAEHFGVHPTTIIKRLDKEGISRNKCGKKPTLGISKEQLVSLYADQALSFSCIARELGCSERSVRRLVDQYGIKRRPTPRQVLTEGFLAAKLSAGSTAYSISKDTGISVPTIYRYLSRFGLFEGDPRLRTLSGQTELEVVSGYLQGRTTAELGAQYSVSFNCINAVLSRNQVPIRTAQDYQRVLPPVESLLEMYFEEGLSIQQIATAYGVTKYAVWNQIGDVGLRSKSEALLGERNGMYGAKHSEATRSSMAKAYVDGTRECMVGKYFRSGHIKTPHQGVKRTRSSWETLVAEYFLRGGTDFYYEPEVFELLSSSGVVISYLPDFYLPADELYIEVKGFDWHGRLDKVQLFVEQTGNNIEVWRQDDLQHLGIL